MSDAQDHAHARATLPGNSDYPVPQIVHDAIAGALYELRNGAPTAHEAYQLDIVYLGFDHAIGTIREFLATLPDVTAEFLDGTLGDLKGYV